MALLLGLGLFSCAPRAELFNHPIVSELQTGIEGGSATFDHGLFDEILQAHVVLEEGGVDYAGLKEDEGKLDEYLASLAEAPLEELTESEQLALLINAYNGYTLKLILENYPGISSIQDLSNPWTTERYVVGGHTLSLDQIEHNIIRPLYKDPRIHFVVNCAAKDCPYLADEALTGERLEEQLEERTRAILQDSNFVRVEGNRLHFTRIMHWYGDDFVNSDFKGAQATVAAYIAGYATDEVRRFIEAANGDPATRAMEYDWTLNDVSR